jgi:BASS family bile acid:Na+ symporter
MSEILFRVSKLAIMAFLVSSMLGVGLSLTFRQIFTPLKQVRLMLAALVANFLIVPGLAVGVAKAFELEEPLAAGLLLLGFAPGVPFLPKLAELAHGDRGFAVGLMLILLIGSVISLPLVLPLVVPSVDVGVGQMARPLLLLMILPLAAGLLFKARFRYAARGIRVGLRRFSNFTLVIAILLVVMVNFRGIVNLAGTGAITAVFLLIILGGLAGYWLGGSRNATRKVMVLGTGFRNVAAALVVSESDLPAEATVMLVVAALLALLFLLPIARIMQKTGRCECYHRPGTRTS